MIFLYQVGTIRRTFYMAEKDNIPEMRPTFDAIRRTDENNKEYWSSRDLCNAMGYSTNWKFQNVINKAIAVANQKGMKIDDHFNQTVDMVKLGSGAYRKVNIFRLSRMSCMIIAENADGKKPLVQQAREYFHSPFLPQNLSKTRWNPIYCCIKQHKVKPALK